MKVIIKKLNNNNGQETGAILTAFVGYATTLAQKNSIEKQLTDYAFGVLYPSQLLGIYSDVNSDSPAITVIRDINNLPYTEIDL